MKDENKKILYIVGAVLLVFVVGFASIFSGSLFQGNLSGATTPTWERCQLLKKYQNSYVFSARQVQGQTSVDEWNNCRTAYGQTLAAVTDLFTDFNTYDCYAVKDYFNAGVLSQVGLAGTLGPLCVNVLGLSNWVYEEPQIPLETCMLIKKYHNSGLYSPWSNYSAPIWYGDKVGICHDLYPQDWANNHDIVNLTDRSVCMTLKSYHNSGVFSSNAYNPAGGLSTQVGNCAFIYQRDWDSNREIINIPSKDYCTGIKHYHNSGLFSDSKYSPDRELRDQVQVCSYAYFYDWQYNSGRQDLPSKSLCDEVKYYFQQGLWTGNKDKQFTLSPHMCSVAYGTSYWNSQSSFTPASTTPATTPAPTTPATTVVTEKEIAPEGEFVVKLTPRCDSFTDNLNTNLDYIAIEFVRKYAIFGGYQNCTFRGNNNINRAELTKVIIEGLGYQTNLSGGPHFSDVASDTWFYEFVETAYNNFVIGGYPDGTFKPQNNVNRAELAKIFVNASLLHSQLDTVTASDLCTGMSNNEWYSKYFAVLVKNGIVDKFDCRPADLATRTEVAQMFFKYSVR
jgi:hypothetical protein